MKNGKTVYHVILLVIGLGLTILAFIGKVDEFWNGMGSALLIIGTVRLIRDYRLNKNK